MFLEDRRRFGRAAGFVLRFAIAVLVLAGADGSARAAQASEPTPVPAGWMRLDDGRRPNLLLITVDTLRADHVGRNEHWSESFTPKLDALARESTVFRVTTTTATATRPAIASLLTGLYPGRHPVRNNEDRLDASALVLAELLTQAGYQTASFYGNEVIGERSGLLQGISTAEGFARYLGSSDEAIATRAVDWLGERDRRDAPFFLWLHLMDPHGPYFSAPETVRTQVPRDDGLPDRALEPSTSNYGLGVLPRYQLLRTARDAKTYRWRYRAEVRWTDEQIGRVLATLDALGLRESTLVVVTADHGEGLGEHDAFFQHGWNVFEPSARVPLLVRHPRRVDAGRAIETPVSLVDVLPTLVHGLGLAAPVRLEGRDLSDLLHGAERDAPVYVVSACPNELVAVRHGRFKLVHTPLRTSADGGEWKFDSPGWQLFDLEQDSSELEDVSAREPEARRRLEALVRTWEMEHGYDRSTVRASRPLDAEEQERLRRLGYVD